MRMAEIRVSRLRRIPVFLVLGDMPTELVFNDYILLPDVSYGKIERKKVGITIMGPTERLLHRLGFKYMISLMIKDKSRFISLFRREVDDVLSTIGQLKNLDFIMISDDAAWYGGPLYPKWFIKGPYLEAHRQIAEKIRSVGSQAFLHADGNYGEYFRELSSIWDVLHPLDIYPRGSYIEFKEWVDRALSLKEIIESKIASGIPLELCNTKLVAEATIYFLLRWKEEGIILSNFHPPMCRINIVKMFRELRRLGLS